MPDPVIRSRHRSSSILNKTFFIPHSLATYLTEQICMTLPFCIQVCSVYWNKCDGACPSVQGLLNWGVTISALLEYTFSRSVQEHWHKRMGRRLWFTNRIALTTLPSREEIISGIHSIQGSQHKGKGKPRGRLPSYATESPAIRELCHVLDYLLDFVYRKV